MPRKRKFKVVEPQGDKLEKNKKIIARKKANPRKLAPRPFACGTLTKAGRHSKIVSALRAGSKWWKPKTEALKSSSVGNKINKSTGRSARHHKCAHCGGDFPTKEVQVDHIVPMVDKEGFQSWDVFIDRLFCEMEGMQVLCKPCHQIKTNEEKAERALYKKETKEDATKEDNESS
jgi:5-methylcytosine-specific restriction endonuclease McrA